jgi:hypothetical protein
MWFEFGICVFIGLIYWIYSTQPLFWKPKSAQSRDGNTFLYCIKSDHLFVGLEGPAGFQCLFKPERTIDRVFKSLRLCKEYQTGSQEFDRNVYLVSDNEQAQRFISGHAAIGAGVLKLFELRCDGSKLEELMIYKGRLYAVYKGKYKTDDLPTWVEAVIPILRDIAICFEDAKKIDPSKFKDKFLVRSMAISAFCIGSFFNAWVGFVRVFGASSDTILDKELVASDALMVSGTVWILLALVVIFLIGRTSRAHYVYLQTVILASLGLFGTIFVGLHDYNIEMDHKFAVVREYSYAGKFTTTSKSHTYYFVTVQALTGNNEACSKNVSQSEYREAKAGDIANVYIRPGALGYRWVSDMSLTHR